ncbi:hypothetical protein KA977_13905 [Candidatus Dependentiae bacterium]|nr:hypothetical protein [Candidatus Dependentiae bacterium]
MKISDNFYARLFRTGISLAAVFIIGICGYILIEDMSFTDAFYMTVITVSTTGLYVGNTLTEPGKYFTALLVILGIATFVQGINIITTFVMNDYYNAMFKKRRLLKMISKFNKHIIICGCGELGLEIIKEIKKKARNALLLIIIQQ